MFFLISKIISLFLKPIVIIAFLILFALLAKNLKYKNVLLYLSLGILLLFGNRFISTQLLQALEYDPVEISKLGTYECGIVLTGITDPTMYPKDRIYINYGADRIFHTIQLYRMNKIKKILITGTNGLYPENKSEAEELKQVFMFSKIPPKDILIETKAKNTMENAILSKKVLERMKIKEKCLVITSAFHMRRADACFTKAGIPHDVFPTNFYGNQPSYSWDNFILPSEDAIGLWVSLIHEIVGEAVYKVMGYI